MASFSDRPRTPTTTRETELLDNLACALRDHGLTADVRHSRREIIARQPAVVGATGAPPVGLSQVVHLARSRTVAGALAWVVRLDDGFRGQNGSQFDPICQGDDIAQAATLLGKILALSDRESVG